MLVLAADTVVSIGRRILPKTETRDAAHDCLTALSGRGHRVSTGCACLPRVRVSQSVWSQAACG